MISINLYQPGIVDKQIDFPENWNELETPELHAIARVMLSDLEEQTAAKSIILLEIIKHRAGQKKIPIEIIQQLNPEDLTLSGLPLVEFVYQGNSLSKQPYPRLKNFIGPQSDFENLTAGEYEAAEIFYLQFKENADPALLASMAAVLYRPSKKEFISYKKNRDEYVTYDHEANAWHFKKMPAHVLFTMFIWYSGCRGMLPLYFPALYEGEGSAAQDLLVFTKCIHAAAGVKNGNRYQVRRTLLKELYFEMNQEAVKANELKEYYERNK